MTGRSTNLIARDERMAQLASIGKTAAEIADVESVGILTVYRWANGAGIRLTRKSRTEKEALDARSEKMVSMYRQGVTFEKIGAQFKLTRQRVRQILKKAGVSGADGGAHLVAESKRAEKAMAREMKYMATYGMPSALVKQLQRDGVTHACNQQRKNAAIRGIEWNLTFAQWFAIWQASGKLHLRGRGKGKYLMSRVSDAGCYELGNVHIQLCTENSREAVDKWRGKEKASKGVFCLYPGREMAWWAKVGKKSLGFFKTEGEASDARAAYFLANPEIAQRVAGRGYTPIKSAKGKADRYQVTVNRVYVGTFDTPELAQAARAEFIAKRDAAIPTKEVA